MKYAFKISFLSVILIFSLSLLGITSFANNGLKEINIVAEVDCVSQPPGGSITLSTSLLSNSENKISSFMMYIYFDTSVLSCSKVSLSDITKLGNIHTSEHDGCLTVIYLEDKSCIPLAEGQKQKIFDIIFSVNDNVSIPSNTAVSTLCNSIIDTDFNFVNIKNAENTKLLIEYPDETDASLERLTPERGDLIPAFNPDVTQYYMEVQSDINSIIFDAVPKDKQSTVKVNRKSLKSCGSTTDFKITTYSADGKSIVYTVSVYRRTKEEDDTSSTSNSSVSSSASSKSAALTSSGVKTASSSGSNAGSVKSSSALSAKSLSSSSSANSFKFGENGYSYNENSVSSEVFSPQSIVLGNNTPKIFALVFAVLLIVLAFIIIFYKRRETTSSNVTETEKDEINQIE